MQMYLDLCCLRRPFDDQSQPRVRLESEAVLALLAVPSDRLLFLRSPAHDLENDQNPVIQRAARVRELLARFPLRKFADQDLVQRIQELQGLGFKNFDAFHLACAELGGAEVFATCDDRLLKAARREASRLRVRVENPLDLMKEVIP